MQFCGGGIEDPKGWAIINYYIDVFFPDDVEADVQSLGAVSE